MQDRCDPALLPTTAWTLPPAPASSPALLRWGAALIGVAAALACFAWPEAARADGVDARLNGTRHGHAQAKGATPATPATPPSPPTAPKAAAPLGDAQALGALRDKLAARLGGSAQPPAAASPSQPRGGRVVRVVARERADEEPAAAPLADAHAATPARRGAPAARPGARGAVPIAAARPHGARAPSHHGTAAHGAHAWDYEGDLGPARWGSLKPEFSACATGQRQSPIDIRGGLAVDLEPIRFDYRPVDFKVIDNGHTVQVNLAAGNAIEVQGRRFELLQFHFHRPSEERIDGRQFDMVAHLVHKDTEGRLAVVAVLLEKGGAHTLLQDVWRALPLEKHQEVAAMRPIDMAALLPQDRRYYTYMGSLTTPPCSEGVLWMVMQQPVQVAPEQIGVFARLYPMNARPVQNVAGRTIKMN